MNDFINNLVLKHILGEPGVVGFGVLVDVVHLWVGPLEFQQRQGVEDDGRQMVDAGFLVVGFPLLPFVQVPIQGG